MMTVRLKPKLVNNNSCEESQDETKFFTSKITSNSNYTLNSQLTKNTYAAPRLNKT